MFLTIFSETGLVIASFLPGDSLLFISGVMANKGNLNILILLPLFILASTLGDTSNYYIGKFIGKKLLYQNYVPLLNKEHLNKTNAFYKRHGGKIILISRFIPIARTFAPFVAGMGAMPYRRFSFFNVIGAFCWVSFFTLVGFIFGGIPYIKNNFIFVILGIVIISMAPITILYISNKKK